MYKVDKRKPKVLFCSCGGSLVKKGFTKAGTQRYQCKDCKRTVSFSFRKKMNFREDVLGYGVDYVRGYAKLDTYKEMEAISKLKDANFYFDDSGLDINGFEKEKSGIKWEKRIKYFFGNNEEKNMVTSLMFPHTVLSWLLSNVDSDNTNEINGFFLGLKVKITKNKDYYLVSHNGENIMMIYKLTRKDISFYKLDIEERYLRFDFYGSFFALDRLGVIGFSSFYKTFIQAFSDFKVTRLDFMIDFKDKEVIDIMGAFKCLGSPEMAYWTKEMKVESVYYGKYKTSENKRALVRVYDKLLQVKTKRLEYLYTPYFEYENVARFEVEYRSLLLADFHFQKEWVLDEKKLLGMLKKFMNSKNKKLNFDFSKIEEVERKRDISKKAVAKYFVARLRPLWVRANECGVLDLELMSLIKGKSGKEVIKIIESQLLSKKIEK